MGPPPSKLPLHEEQEYNIIVPSKDLAVISV